MRLGLSDLSETSPTMIESEVAQVLLHPEFRKGQSNFDIGIAVADHLIEFTDFVMPICLPMRPVNEYSYLSGQMVSLNSLLTCC